METCKQCGEELTDRWQFCPRCGSPRRSCCAACGEPLEAGWRVCPVCGKQIAGGPAIQADRRSAASPMSEDEARRLNWKVRFSLGEAYHRPQADLMDRLATPGLTFSAIMSLAEPSNFKRLAIEGFNRMIARIDAEHLGELPQPQRFQHLLRESEARLLARLDPAIDGVRHAADQVRALNIPEGEAGGFIKGVADASNPSTQTGQGALAGAVIGSLIPGVGTAIGAAVGGAVGGVLSNSKNKKICEHYCAQVDKLTKDTSAIFEEAWDLLAHTIPGDHPFKLQRSAFFRDAEAKWEALSAGLMNRLGKEDVAALRHEVERFIETSGPLLAGLSVFIRLCIPPIDQAPELASPRVQEAIALYPHFQLPFEDAADVSLHLGRLEEASALVQRGLALGPASPGLKLSQVETIAAGPEPKAAEGLADQAWSDGSVDAYFHQARGLVRAGRLDDAVGVVRKWQAKVESEAAVGRIILKDQTLRRLADEGHVKVEAGLTGELRGIIEAYFAQDGKTLFYGLPPGEKKLNAKAAFVQQEEGEEFLYFRDWSAWDNAKAGLAISDRRVQWKCAFEEPVRVSLLDLPADEISSDGSFVRLAGNKVDVDDEDYAAAMVAVLQEFVRAITSGAFARSEAQRPAPESVGDLILSTLEEFKCGKVHVGDIPQDKLNTIAAHATPGDLAQERILAVFDLTVFANSAKDCVVFTATHCFGHHMGDRFLFPLEDLTEVGEPDWTGKLQVKVRGRKLIALQAGGHAKIVIMLLGEIMKFFKRRAS